MQQTVLITGTSGYIGARCAEALVSEGHDVRWGTRRPMPAEAGKAWTLHGDLAESDAIATAVEGCNTVVHFAGHAHVPESPQAIAAAERTNVLGTARLASACAKAGVERLIFMSSALVLSGARDRDGRISDQSPPRPLTAYAETKARAEIRLREIGAGSELGWVILRPPMVYGPGSPGNFSRLVRAVDAGLPLPLGRATGPKSFIYVDNLVSAVSEIVRRPEVRGETFLIADAEVTSTAALIRHIAAALGRSARLLPVPQTMCKALGQLIGKGQDIERLFEPLQIDIAGIKARLDWHPPYTLERGVRDTVAACRKPDRPAQ